MPIRVKNSLDGQKTFPRYPAGLNTIRGLAILAVVLAHCIGALTSKEEIELTFFVSSTESLRMPIFAFISGFIFSNRNFQERLQITVFAKTRFRRLLVPLTVFSCAYWFITKDNMNRNLLESLFQNWNYLWFLQGLVFVNVVLFLFTRISSLLNKAPSWTTLAFSFFAIQIFVNELFNFPEMKYWPAPLWLGPGLYLAPYLFLGLAIGDLKFRLRRRTWLLVIGFWIVGWAIYVAFEFSAAGLSSRASYYVSLILSSTLCLIFIKISSLWESRSLAYLGTRSIQIYLVHVPMIFVLLRFGVNNLEIPRIAIVGLAFLIVISISLITEKIVQRFRPLRFLLWGETIR
jgi:peptidoglycan/LPS O-acetylase OafA/YrhL